MHTTLCLVQHQAVGPSHEYGHGLARCWHARHLYDLHDPSQNRQESNQQERRQSGRETGLGRDGVTSGSKASDKLCEKASKGVVQFFARGLCSCFKREALSVLLWAFRSKPSQTVKFGGAVVSTTCLRSACPPVGFRPNHFGEQFTAAVRRKMTLAPDCTPPSVRGSRLTNRDAVTHRCMLHRDVDRPRGHKRRLVRRTSTSVL